MRAVVWAAVSSKSQLKGDSNEEQVRDGKTVCEQFNWDVVETLEVPGLTRDFIFFTDAEHKVEAYRRLRLLCEQRAFDVLVCRGRDRLGRTDALISQVEELCKRIGQAQIYSMAMPTFIPEGKLAQDRGALYAAAIERATAQAELIELRRRHSAGMKARIRKGLPASNVPYGYKKTHKDLPPMQVPEEIATLRQIYALYMDGAGCPRIAGWLNRHTVPTQRGGKWRDNTIKYMLDNAFYAGWVTYGQLAQPGKHKPVWTAEEWIALKAERHHRRITRGKAATPYSGLVRCAICNHSMGVCSVSHLLVNGEPRRYRYFRCVEGHQRRMEYRENPHHTQVAIGHIREAVLEQAEKLRDPAEMENELRYALAAEKHAARLQQKAELEAALEESRAVVKKLLDAHIRWGRLSAEAFEETMNEAAAHQGKLETALAGVLADLEAMPDPETRARRWQELAYGDLKTILDDPDAKRANAWLARHIKAIWCSGNRVERVELI